MAVVVVFPFVLGFLANFPSHQFHAIFREIDFTENLPKTQAQKGKQRLPYFIFVSPDRQLRLGGSGLLKCIAGGNPLPHITWILNGKVLKV